MDQNKIQVMLDLETLSTANNAAIVAIGACVFSTEFKRGTTHHPFYATIDPVSCENAGLVISASTVMWWMQQSESARDALKDGSPLPEALMGFDEYLNVITNDGERAVCMWGNGSDFDNVILKNAYAVADRKVPWKFWNDRCYRTFKGIAPSVPKPERLGVHHNALDDAVFQAQHAVEIAGSLGIKL